MNPSMWGALARRILFAPVVLVVVAVVLLGVVRVLRSARYPPGPGRTCGVATQLPGLGHEPLNVGGARTSHPVRAGRLGRRGRRPVRRPPDPPSGSLSARRLAAGRDRA